MNKQTAPADILLSLQSGYDETHRLASMLDYDWVDLGLSVKWATCNMGASSPSSYGNYYAWDDPALAIMRSGIWRLPTRDEWLELRNNCKWTWTTLNDINGYMVTGANGNSIFLPAAGCRNGTKLMVAGEIGHYWSSTIGNMESYFHIPWLLLFYPNEIKMICDTYFRYSARAVSE